MSDIFIRPLSSIRMLKANDVPRDRAIRVFRQSPEDWQVQIAAPIGLGTFGLRDGKDFIIACASCSLADLHALRDAIDAQIATAEETTYGLTPAQLKALRAANDGPRGWYPYGGPEHRVARRLTELGLYHAGTGRPTDRGRAYLAEKT